MTLPPGRRVRTRLRAAPGHTRLPRYAAGRVGEIATVRGTFPLADAVAAGATDPPAEPLYSVRFDAHELWGEAADRHLIHLDLYERYLQPLPEEGTP